MDTTNNPQYGHFAVRLAELTEPILGFGYSLGMCSMSGKTSYGVFKINHARRSYDHPENTDPKKAHKIDLEPVSSIHFQRRDWYSGSVLDSYSIKNGYTRVFNNYDKALAYANMKNGIQEVKPQNKIQNAIQAIRKFFHK